MTNTWPGAAPGAGRPGPALELGLDLGRAARRGRRRPASSSRGTRPSGWSSSASSRCSPSTSVWPNRRRAVCAVLQRLLGLLRQPVHVHGGRLSVGSLRGALRAQRGFEPGDAVEQVDDQPERGVVEARARRAAAAIRAEPRRAARREPQLPVGVARAPPAGRARRTAGRVPGAGRASGDRPGSSAVHGRPGRGSTVRAASARRGRRTSVMRSRLLGSKSRRRAELFEQLAARVAVERRRHHDARPRRRGRRARRAGSACPRPRSRSRRPLEVPGGTRHLAVPPGVVDRRRSRRAPPPTARRAARRGCRGPRRR